jgi:diadenosine tetraphosphatase ApaH/serine/threonine PP2A family protein phosphatase
VGALMRIAFLADIHGNLEAMDATLSAARAGGFDQLIVLGDLVGYGPDPAAIVETVATLIDEGAICIKGNHEEAVCATSSDMTENARIAADWTRTQLRQPHFDFLNSLPMSVRHEDRLYVHASARKPEQWPYIRSADAAEACLAATDARLVFTGHTHIPAVFHGLPGQKLATFIPRADIEIPISGFRRAVIVIGSVGQPRDRIPAACYGLYDTGQRTIAMKRAPYDHALTAEKIRRAGLPFWLADRLALGK